MVGGSVPVVVGGDCPAGTYLFYWNGDHSLGEGYACTSPAGTPSNINVASTDGTDRVDTGGVTGKGFVKTANNQYMCWTVTNEDIINNTLGTVWMKLKADGARSTAAMAWESGNSGSPSTEQIKAVINSTNDQILGHYEGDNAGQEVAGSNDVVVDDTWTAVGYYWNVTLDYHGTDDGDGTWTEVTEDLTILDPKSDLFCIGENITGGAESTAGTYIFWIDDVYVFADKHASPY
jgi:hypothetical protein